MTCCVYAIIGPHGRQYIGGTVNFKHRRIAHLGAMRRKKKGTSRRMIADFEEHGPGAFIFRIIERCDRSNLRDRERHYLQTLMPFYNVDQEPSGEVGCKRSEEARKAMSDAALRRWSRESERKAQSRRLVGKAPSQETIEKRRAKLVGQKRTDEQKARMRAAERRPRPLGIFPSPQARENLKASWCGPDGMERRARASERARAAWARRKQVNTEQES